MKNRIKSVRSFAISTLLVLSTVFGTVISLAGYDGEIKQNVSHADETSMYLYTLEILLDNPCNSKDMDKDAVCELWFDFEYVNNNGRGDTKTYRLDMSWKNGRNLNDEILKKNFIRSNDNACKTKFSVWVPGMVKNIRVHLNMDGGERLGFTVGSVLLNGFKMNTDTDYVSSAYYDSDASIPCRMLKSEIMTIPEDGDLYNGTVRDQFDGKVYTGNINEAKKAAEAGDYGMFYHFDF